MIIPCLYTKFNPASPERKTNLMMSELLDYLIKHGKELQFFLKNWKSIELFSQYKGLQEGYSMISSNDWTVLPVKIIQNNKITISDF